MEKLNLKERFYRDISGSGGMKRYTVRVEETDMLIISQKFLQNEIKEEIEQQRKIIKNYIKDNPEFYTSFSPVICKSEKKIIKLMCDSAEMTETGPMASVAGAIAEIVGKKISSLTKEFFIENGGDIYAKIDKEFNIGIYAGNSPLSLRVGIKLKSVEVPIGVATSSGTVGHSFSYGNADAVTVVAKSAAFADGAATYFGNIVKDKINKGKIEESIKKFPFIEGLLIIKEREMFLWGNILLTSF